MKDNQMYQAGALYFDPVYKARTNAAMPDLKLVNGVPTFPPDMDMHAPYQVIPPSCTNDDGSVTVNIYEPTAEHVQLIGVNFSLPGGPYDLTPAGNGYFSVTLHGLRPGLHHYAFLVDGVRKLNPEAVIVFGCSTMVNLL